MNAQQEEMVLVCRDALLHVIAELELAVPNVPEIVRETSLHAALLTLRLTIPTLTSIPRLGLDP